MPAPRSDKVGLLVQLTPDEVKAIHTEKRRRGGKATLSSVFEEALEALLASDLRTLVIPALGTSPRVCAAYRILRPTEARLNEALARHRHTLQQVVRAAVQKADLRSGGDPHRRQ